MPIFNGRYASHQHGAALYVVLVIVLMSSLLAIWAARSALFHEILTGNDADYQRTFEAAQILMRDAETDIQNGQTASPACKTNNSSGNPCRLSSPIHFPIHRSELVELINYLDSLPTGCSHGICRKRAGAQDFWSDPPLLAQMTAENIGARYGQFTGAASGPGGNPILAMQQTGNSSGAHKGAWYWIEILPFVDAPVRLISGYENNAYLTAFAPDSRRPWIYRITVYARGNKKGTTVVLQSVLSLQSEE